MDGFLERSEVFLIIRIILGAIILGAAVGAAAAELMDGAFDGAVQAGFLAAEAVQEAYSRWHRDGQ